MSHFTVMVIGDDPEEQLAPYCENEEVDEYCVREVSETNKQRMLDYYKKEMNIDFLDFESCYERFGEDWNGNRWRKDENGTWQEYSTYNPNSKWDWYVLGGRWSGCFIRLKEGATSGVIGEPGVFNNKTSYDAALKGDIDFEAIRKEHEAEARSYYREVVDKCGGTIPKLEIPWQTLCSDPRFENLSIKEKREMYHSQESIKKWKEAGYDTCDMIGPTLEDFQCSEEEYVSQVVSAAFVPYAVVMDSQWYARGEMGWWGISSNECSRDEWCSKVWEMVNDLPDDTLISFYDCHI